MPTHSPEPADSLAGSGAPPGSAWEVFGAFLRLGLSAFGGPVAHLGYFRAEFVQRRRWLDDAAYSDLVALCQFLPGPASSQVCMALGLGRAGWRGALAAWLGFTLPSACALILFALGVQRWTGLATSGAVHGLKIAAVAVVAQAVLGMGRSLCPDWPRAGLAVVAALIVLAVPSAGAQWLALGLGALVGWRVLALPAPAPAPHRDGGLGRRGGAWLVLLFATLLVLLPLLAAFTGLTWVRAVAVVYQAGALVFGGGHVVLPLLQAGVVAPGWIDNASFVAGYGAAQAVPGPLFTFAAYLGAAMPAVLGGGWAGGLALLLAIFAPAALLVLGALPFWASLRQRGAVRRALAGVNAAVVGVLGAALYDPVWTSAIQSRGDVALALGVFGLLLHGRCPPVLAVGLAALGGWWLAGR